MSKKTEQLNMAVAPEHLSRAKRLNRSTGLKPTEIAHAGFIREIERLEQQASPVTPKEAKTIEAFKKVTGSADITPVLAAAMRDYVQREAKAPYIGRPAPIIDTTGISIRKSA